MAKTIVTLKPILPENAHFEVFQTAIVKTLDEEMGEVIKLFNRFTNSWTHKPKWRKEIKNRKGGFVGRISTRSKPFVYVEGGTRIRKVTMTGGFVPKTTPRSLRSGPGQAGKKVFTRRPKPGIKARESRFVIENLRKIPAAKNLFIRISFASKHLFHGGGRNQR